MVLGDVGIHDAAEAVIVERLLVQPHANAPHHAPHDLAVSRLQVQDTPRGDRIDNASDAVFSVQHKGDFGATESFVCYQGVQRGCEFLATGYLPSFLGELIVRGLVPKGEAYL